MNKKYAYQRVSTSLKAKKRGSKQNNYEERAKQDYERQKYILSKSGIEFDQVFEEHITGGVRGDQRQEFNKMLEVLEEGDLVVFTETSRFARNYIDAFDILDIITLQYKASVKFLSNNITLNGGEKLNPYEWLTISNFFIMDEFQKRQIGYNTKNKLCALKEQGVRLGRPETIPQEQKDKIVELYKQGMSQNKISQELNISRTVVANRIKVLLKGE